MSTIAMDAGRWVLAAADTEVQLIAAAPQARRADLDGQPGGTALNEVLALSLRRFEHHHGRSWVPGRLVLTADALEFRPREFEGFPTPIVLRMSDVVSVEAISRLFTKMVRVEVGAGQMLSLRCRSPFTFAEQLQMAAGAVRAAAA
jgi:hypothetical protein